METATQLTPTSELCEEKAAKIMRWLAESEDVSKVEFSVSRLFESGVLQENTKAFLHVLLEEQFPGDRIGLELPPEQLHAIIEDALVRTYLYLLTPQSFIADFLCVNGQMLEIIDAMLSRLSYFVSYPYFPEMIDEWLAFNLRSGRNEIPKSELQGFLSDVDRSVITNSSLEELSIYLAPLFEFHSDTKLLSRNTILFFFADKHLVISPALEREEYTPEDVAFALKEAVVSSPSQESTEEFPPIEEYDAFLKELREVGVVLPPPAHIVHALPNEQKKVLPPIEMFIDSKLRSKCLEDIFHSNVNEYNRAIGLLNAIKDYSQAELNLRTLLEMHKAAPDSKVAIRLNEALRLRFGNRVRINIP